MEISDVGVRSIGQCQQLKDLHIFIVLQDSIPAGCNALLQLTQLTALTSLYIAACLEGVLKEFSAEDHQVTNPEKQDWT